MNVSRDALRKSVVQTLNEIESVISSIEHEASNRGIRPEDLRDERGSWALAPLLLAKIQAINTLVLLNE